MPARRSFKPLRGAVVGYGFISSKGHVPAYLDRLGSRGDVEIVAIADLCSARRAQARKDLRGVQVFSDSEALLDAMGDELDFVDICTPPCDHARIAHAALDRGLHVLCEKPLTPTLSEAASLLEHAARVRRVIFPCHNYKHAPVVKAIREILESGRIGQVRSITLNTFRNTHAKGVAEWKPDWRRERKYSGGGIAMDHGSHTFYLAFEWMGGYPTAVSAKMATQSEAYDTEDNFSAVLSFPNGLAHAQLTWTAGVRKVIYTLQGEHGAITVDDDDLQLALASSANGSGKGPTTWRVERKSISSHWMDASHVHWFNSLFDDFKSAIETGAFVGKEAREAYFCIQVITHAYRSAAQECREVPLSTEIGWAERWFPVNRVPIGR